MTSNNTSHKDDRAHTDTPPSPTTAAAEPAPQDSIQPIPPAVNSRDFAAESPRETSLDEKLTPVDTASGATGSDTVVAGVHVANPADPLDFGRHRRDNVTRRQIKQDHPKGKHKKLHKFYTRQNELIDQFLGADDEERLAVEAGTRDGPKVKFAVNASFVVNFCLFVIQLYAAISTGSLALFATTADAFMDLVSSFVMLVTSRLAQRPSIYKYPVGRTRIETIGIILFCALMTTVAIQLIIESGRALGEGDRDSEPLQIISIVFVSVAIFCKASLMVYCFLYRKYPSVHIFFIDHRNDIAINSFGLIMAIVGDKFVWYLDPVGAIIVALIILSSWTTNAFEQIWLLVGKAAPRDFISKLVYITMTHDSQILKIDTCRAYHAGQKYYVEVDIVMDENLPLRTTHDVAQSLQRKIEGLADVERAFVHVDYEDEHDVHEEHKPLYARSKDKDKTKVGLKERFLGARKKGDEITGGVHRAATA